MLLDRSASYSNDETIEGTDKWITDAAEDKDEINQVGEDMTENILVWPNMLHNCCLMPTITKL